MKDVNELQKYLSKTAAAKHWDKIGVSHHHGIIIPLFSLRCENSSGIGEFLDLKMVIDWCKNVGFDVIQLLPLNETGQDPSPYNALSSCALNPLHISLYALEGLNENTELKEKLKEFKIFNSYNKYHYLQLKNLKLEFLNQYYLYIYDKLIKDENFEFFIKNNPWIEEYALFRAIEEEQGYKSWDLWPFELQDINEKNKSKYIEKYQSKIQFYFALQYFCFNQLIEVKNYAEQNNIFIFGDVPILLSQNSCDVWYNRSIFDTNYVAGAPPDGYNVYGQKWGFPLYNWEELKKNNYNWFKRRLNSISNIYHMYRVDHAVGFFRIWAMHINEMAMEGRFLPQNPTLWKNNGIDRLKMMLNSSPLLPIAEDLGLIPKIVYKTLKKLGISGTKIVPWQKTLLGYLKLNKYDPLSLVSLSTHDSHTFAQWWRDYPEEAKKFAKPRKWSYDPNFSYYQRKQLLHEIHHNSSIFHINLLQEYLALYPELVWDNLEDERINIPGTMNSTNWTYRFKPTFEQIMEHTNLNKDLKEILS